MGLDIFFVEDIRNALLAADKASAATVAAFAEWLIPPHMVREPEPISTELALMNMRAYREGYKAALTTVALAFGITPPEITPRSPNDPLLPDPHYAVSTAPADDTP